MHGAGSGGDVLMWSEEMVDRLCALKLTGMAFEAAWAVALSEIPPAGREFRGELTLLVDPREMDPVEFLRRACSDAWAGRKPHLAALQKGLQDVLDGDGVIAVGRSRTLIADVS